MPAILTDHSTAIELATSLLLLAVVAAAVYTDLRRGLIYNRLTYGAAIAGLALNTIGYGLDGSLSSVKGWLVGAGLFVVFFLLKAMGAGDVKLLAAVGAIKGPLFVLNAFVFTGLAGGVIAIIYIIRRRRVHYFLTSMGLYLHDMVFLRRAPAAGEAGASSFSFPYGLPIAIGSVAALFLSLW